MKLLGEGYKVRANKQNRQKEIYLKRVNGKAVRQNAVKFDKEEL